MKDQGITMGANIRELRKKRGISARVLAEAVNISTPFVYDIENGRTLPSVPVLNAIAQYFGVTTDYLMGLNEPGAPSSADKQTAASDNEAASHPNDPRVIPLTNCRRVPLLSPEATAHCGGGCSFFEITSDSTEFIICTPDELGSPIDDLRPPFAVSSEGNCLQSSGISDGDKLVVNPAVEVRDFNVCVICWRDHLSAKRIRKLQNGDIELRSDNGVTVVPADDVENGLFEIWGKVISIHRKLRHNVF